MSIEAEILNLLKDPQDEMGVSFLFIAHDLSVVAQISHRVAVMYVGRFVGFGPTRSLFFRPRHPDTRAKLSAVPLADPDIAYRPDRLEIETPPAPPTHPPTHPQSGTFWNLPMPITIEPPRLGEPWLLTPGPLRTSHAAKAALLRDWGGWDGDVRVMTATLRARLVALLGDGGDGCACVPLRGRAPLAWRRCRRRSYPAMAARWCWRTGPAGSARRASCARWAGAAT